MLVASRFSAGWLRQVTEWVAEWLLEKAAELTGRGGLRLAVLLG